MCSLKTMELPCHEDLSKLARDDPEAYEALRRDLIGRFIEQAPDRIKPRLNGIQFRVDHVRNMSRSALGSAVKVYELMWKSFLSLNYNWQDFSKTKDALFNGQDLQEPLRRRPIKTAQLIKFKPRCTIDRT